MAIKDIVKGICNVTRCKYDVYTKERSDELFKLKGDFAILTGTLNVSDAANGTVVWNVPLPEGFDFQNTVIFGLTTQPIADANTMWKHNNNLGAVGDVEAALLYNTVTVVLYTTGRFDKVEFKGEGVNFKVILMKTN